MPGNFLLREYYFRRTTVRTRPRAIDRVRTFGLCGLDDARCGVVIRVWTAVCCRLRGLSIGGVLRVVIVVVVVADRPGRGIRVGVGG